MMHSLWKPWWMGLAVFLLVGAILGGFDPALGRVAMGLGFRPGVATAISVNLLMPLAAIVLASGLSRLVNVWLGALGMTLAFLFGLSAAYAPAGGWNVRDVLAGVPPVLVLAFIGYGVLGSLTLLLGRNRHGRDGVPSESA